MTLDPITRRCARLLWAGYEAAGRMPVVQLDGFVADTAGTPFGTPQHNLCMDQLKRVRQAIVEEPARRGSIAGATFYRITEEGFTLLHEAGYLPEGF
jgi:hypothetical protein